MGEPKLILHAGVFEGDDADVLAAVNRGREQAELEPRSPEEWCWWTRENPLGACVGVARGGDDAIVAAIVGVRRRVLVRGEEMLWIAVTDVFNDFGSGAGLARAKGLVALGRAYGEAFGGHAPDAHPVMYGVPNRRAHRIMRHVGWEILRSENKLCVDPTTVAPTASTAVDVAEVKRFPDEAAATFERFAVGREALVVRDAAHLNWRFADHPRHDYRIALARGGGELRGWAVYRRAAWDGSEDGLLCDWLVSPDDGGATGELIAWAAACARDDGAARLTVNVPDKSPEWARFQDAGFRAFGTGDYLAFRSFQKPMVMSWLFERWYYTLGDTERC